MLSAESSESHIAGPSSVECDCDSIGLRWPRQDSRGWLGWLGSGLVGVEYSSNGRRQKKKLNKSRNEVAPTY